MKLRTTLTAAAAMGLVAIVYPAPAHAEARQPADGVAVTDDAHHAAGQTTSRAAAPDCVLADSHPEGNHPGYDHKVGGNHSAVIVTNTCANPKRIKIVLAWNTDFPCTQFMPGDVYLAEWNLGRFDGLESC